MSQLDALCEAHGVKATAEYGGNRRPAGPGMVSMQGWRVVLTYGRRRLTCDFFTGAAWDREPSAADVLSCLLLDASAGAESFEEYCSNFGVDPDSRAALATWRACRATGPKVERLLRADFDRFARAAH